MLWSAVLFALLLGCTNSQWTLGPRFGVPFSAPRQVFRTSLRPATYRFSPQPQRAQYFQPARIGGFGSFYPSEERPQPPPPPPRVEVIVFADVAAGTVGGWRNGANDIDDPFAVAACIDALGADTRYDLSSKLVISRGNSDLATQRVSAQAILPLLRPDVELLYGASSALPADWLSLEPPTFGGEVLELQCMTQDLQVLAHYMQQAPATTTFQFAVLSPMTDVACLLRSRPQLESRINLITFLGGRKHDQEDAYEDRHHEFTFLGKEGFGDFNVATDGVAVAYVIENSTVPLTLMSFGASSSVVFKEDALPQLNTAAGRWLHAHSGPWLDKMERLFGSRSFAPWDSHVCKHMVDPGAYQCEALEACVVHCDAEPGDPHTYCASNGADAKKTQLVASGGATYAEEHSECSGPSRGVTLCNGLSKTETSKAFKEWHLNLPSLHFGG